jgi:microcystin-dependent protein
MSRKIRRSYKGAAQEAVLDSSGVTSSTQTSIVLSTSPSTWPTGKFFVVVAPGTAQEEKMCVALAGSTLTVVDPDVVSNSASTNGRGVDDTTARTTIAGGAVVYPVFTAVDADEANELTSAYTTRGDIVYQGASTFARLGVGAADQVLKTNGTDPSWGQVATGGITDLAVTTGKIADDAVTLAKLATAVENLLVPVGTISAYAGAAAPTGWLLCDGTSTSGYASLASLVGATTPDLRGHVLVGKGSAPFNGALLTKFGSTTSTAPHTHDLGTHTHTTAHTHDGYSGNNDADHTHGYTRTGQGSALVINAADTSADVVEVAFGEQTTGQSRPHQHAVTTTSQSTTTSGGPTGGSGGSSAGATHGNVQPSALVNYIIKHD